VAYAEGEDERVLRAAQVAVDDGLARPILIGRPAVIAARIAKAGLRLQPGKDIEICNPEDDPRFRQYWETYHRLMGRQGVTPEAAKEGAAPEESLANDDWERLSLLLKTVEDLELVDTTLAPETLLWRLFHEDEVRVQPPESVVFRCDCDAARIVQVLKGYAPNDRADLADPDGIIRAKCEFCAKTHEIGPEALA
jgi:hypothetical protein